MTPEQAAPVLSISAKTIRKMMRDGRLDGLIIRGVYTSVYRLDEDYVKGLMKGQAADAPRTVNISGLRRAHGTKTQEGHRAA